MNIKHILAISTLGLVCSSAFAHATGATNSTASLTRGQVKNEVRAARAAGTLIPSGEGAYPAAVQSTGSALTRADVKAATREARDRGELVSAGDSDDYPHVYMPSSSSGLTRAEVKAETIRARAAGELSPSGEDSEDRYPARVAQNRAPAASAQVMASGGSTTH